MGDGHQQGHAVVPHGVDVNHDASVGMFQGSVENRVQLLARIEEMPEGDELQVGWQVLVEGFDQRGLAFRLQCLNLLFCHRENQGHEDGVGRFALGVVGEKRPIVVLVLTAKGAHALQQGVAVKNLPCIGDAEGVSALVEGECPF